MAKTQIDLSGIKGLGYRFYGDKSLTASQPHLRYLGVDGQMAEGIFNPISTLGYMSPANNTTKAVTGTTSYLLSSAITIPSRIADASTDAIFFGDEATTGNAGKIVNLDTAIDTSLDTVTTFTNIQNPSFAFNLSSAIAYWANSFIIKPSGSAFPTLHSWATNEDSSGDTHTFSFTVPAALTNSVLVVVAFGKGSDTGASTSITWDGNAMQGWTLSGSAAFSANIAYKVAPAVATGNIIITWTSAKTDMVAYAMLFTNAAQSNPLLSFKSDTSASASETSGMIPVADASYQTKIINVFTSTTSVIIPKFSGATEVNKEEDAGAGTHALYTYTHNTQTFRVEDFIEYQVNGEPKIFFSKGNVLNTDPINDIGIADLDFSNIDEDWLTTTPIGYSNSILIPQGRTMFVLSDNSFLYVLNGNKVHKIDGGLTGGTGGTVTDSVLQFLGTDENAITYIQDGVDLRGKMWIGIHVNSYFDTRVTDIATKSIPMFIGVYVWNRSSVVASMQDFIPIIGVKELKSMHIFQGNVACFTMSVDGYTQFRVWNGSEFKVVQTLGMNAYPVYRKHSVYEEGDRIWWFGNDGKIYCYGRIEPGFDNALYIMGDMSDKVTAEATFSGAGVMVAANATETVTSGNQTQPLAFYLSYKDTAGNHLRKWYPYSTETVATVAQTGHQGNVYTLVKYLPDMSTVKYVDIRCAPTGTGTTTIATIKYYFNGSSTSSFSKTITKDQASRGYIRHEINKPYVNAIQMEIEYSTANTLGAGNDFRPSMALIEYTETTTKG